MPLTQNGVIVSDGPELKTVTKLLPIICGHCGKKQPGPSDLLQYHVMSIATKTKITPYWPHTPTTKMNEMSVGHGPGGFWLCKKCVPLFDAELKRLIGKKGFGKLAYGKPIPRPI